AEGKVTPPTNQVVLGGATGVNVNKFKIYVINLPFRINTSNYMLDKQQFHSPPDAIRLSISRLVGLIHPETN
ncbi:MAG: hypothetical protein ABJK18_04970, partial [Marinobacter sp.]